MSAIVDFHNHKQILAAGILCKRFYPVDWIVSNQFHLLGQQEGQPYWISMKIGIDQHSKVLKRLSFTQLLCLILTTMNMVMVFRNRNADQQADSPGGGGGTSPNFV